MDKSILILEDLITSHQIKISKSPFSDEADVLRIKIEALKEAIEKMKGVLKCL